MSDSCVVLRSFSMLFAADPRSFNRTVLFFARFLLQRFERVQSSFLVDKSVEALPSFDEL